MDEQTAKILREPFAPEKVGKLPKAWCRACSRSSDKVCGEHQKAKCGTCSAYMTTAHLHLDYVGHADVTDRLLSADPEWTWEPAALTPIGLPAIDEHGGLWIRLTVAGVTRLGYGHADGKSGPDAVKEAIGDALRNAGMRFGVGLDLWRKETHADSDDRPQHRRQAAASDAEETAPRSNAVVKAAAAAIDKANSEETLTKMGGLITEREQAGQLTAQEAIDLRRRLVARMNEVKPAGESAAMEAGSVAA